MISFIVIALMMSKKRKGARGSRKMDPKYEWLFYSLFFTALLTIPIWAFSPFKQGLHMSLMIGSSITLFGLYGYDKGRARTGAKRIPEIILHGMAFLGGFIGGFVGMYFFRHKTKKIAFIMVIIVSAILHVMLFLLV